MKMLEFNTRGVMVLKHVCKMSKGIEVISWNSAMQLSSEYQYWY